ncbi:fluoride efflux transporter FluC [Halorubrum aethiopicum]|uniref:fluoride efflux transporter FluC n=1 Tax=Halorubrum aethiopicum TaxID=1758255 RepID=UPI00082D97E6|nr:CrcB family protein [Halorubrum aethiopicum]
MTAASPLLGAVAVGLGGAAGATCRHLVGLAVSGRRSLVAVNVLGSLALGAVLAAPVGSAVALGIGVGFCGAFTTFSSFAVETVSAAESGESGVAVGFALGVLLAAVAAVLLGAAIVAVATP